MAGKFVVGKTVYLQWVALLQHSVMTKVGEEKMKESCRSKETDNPLV